MTELIPLPGEGGGKRGSCHGQKQALPLPTVFLVVTPSQGIIPGTNSTRGIQGKSKALC